MRLVLFLLALVGFCFDINSGCCGKEDNGNSKWCCKSCRSSNGGSNNSAGGGNPSPSKGKKVPNPDKRVKGGLGGDINGNKSEGRKVSKDDKSSHFAKDDEKVEPEVEREDIINKVIITKETITFKRKNNKNEVILSKPIEEKNNGKVLVLRYASKVRFADISKNVEIILGDPIKNIPYMAAFVYVNVGSPDARGNFFIYASGQDGNFKELFAGDGVYYSMEILSSRGIKSTEYMFSKCMLYSLDLGNFDTINVTNMKCMFDECKTLQKIKGLDKFNTSKVTDMGYMFNKCLALPSLPDISKWNTNNVTNMSYMFYNCSSLTSLPDISKWNTSNVTNMSDMFSGCSSLELLPDISKWKTSKVTNMKSMFYLCLKLKALPGISEWDVSKVTDMSSMFYRCRELKTLDLSKFKPSCSNVEKMFMECGVTKLNLSGFRFCDGAKLCDLFKESSVEEIIFGKILGSFTFTGIFYECNNLKKIVFPEVVKNEDFINTLSIYGFASGDGKIFLLKKMI